MITDKQIIDRARKAYCRWCIRRNKIRYVRSAIDVELTDSGFTVLTVSGNILTYYFWDKEKNKLRRLFRKNENKPRSIDLRLLNALLYPPREEYIGKKVIEQVVSGIQLNISEVLGRVDDLINNQIREDSGLKRYTFHFEEEEEIEEQTNP